MQSSITALFHHLWLRNQLKGLCCRRRASELPTLELSAGTIHWHRGLPLDGIVGYLAPGKARNGECVRLRILSASTAEDCQH